MRGRGEATSRGLEDRVRLLGKVADGELVLRLQRERNQVPSSAIECHRRKMEDPHLELALRLQREREVVDRDERPRVVRAERLLMLKCRRDKTWAMRRPSGGYGEAIGRLWGGHGEAMGRPSGNRCWSDGNPIRSDGSHEGAEHLLACEGHPLELLRLLHLTLLAEDGREVGRARQRVLVLRPERRLTTRQHAAHLPSNGHRSATRRCNKRRSGQGQLLAQKMLMRCSGGTQAVFKRVLKWQPQGSGARAPRPLRGDPPSRW